MLGPEWGLAVLPELDRQAAPSAARTLLTGSVENRLRRCRMRAANIGSVSLQGILRRDMFQGPQDSFDVELLCSEFLSRKGGSITAVSDDPRQPQFRESTC